MNESNFSVCVDACFDDTLIKLRKSLTGERFEIISEGDLSGISAREPIHQNVQLLCKYDPKLSTELLKSEKALYIPAINFMVHELAQNRTEITIIDPQITLTPIQVKRMGQAVIKLSEKLKNLIHNL